MSSGATPPTGEATGRTTAATNLATATKSMSSRVRPLIREAADGAFRRATAKLKLPNVPAVFRWDLVGKITQWAVTQYQKPKSAADLELVDSIIDLAADVMGSKDIASIKDEELTARLANVTRLNQMARRYVDRVGAPPAVKKLVNAAAEAAESKGSLDPNTTAKIVIDIANETSGPATAELVAYLSVVGLKKEQPDVAHVLDLCVPVLTKFGAPPAVAKYLNTSAAMARSNVTMNQSSEITRAARMEAQAARELRLPSAIAEMADYVADMTENDTQSQILQKPDKLATVTGHLIGLEAKLNDQLGGPAAISELLLLGASPNKTTPGADEILGLLGKACKEMSFPASIADLLEYVASLAKKGSKPDAERLQAISMAFTEELGAPPAVGKFGKDVAALVRKRGEKPDPVKLSKMVTQLLRKLGMPAFAEIFGKIGAPLLTKGKQPDALTLAAVTPSLMKVMPDVETLNGILGGMQAKLVAPVKPVYRRAVEQLTGQMPESDLKRVVREVLKAPPQPVGPK